jgi:cobalt-zinc-cadmium efflux system membrane fusion protein
LSLIISLNSCTNRDSKPVGGATEVEVLPEDIVELRDDQIKLAGVEMGIIEMRTLSNNLKVKIQLCFPATGSVKDRHLQQ